VNGCCNDCARRCKSSPERGGGPRSGGGVPSVRSSAVGKLGPLRQPCGLPPPRSGEDFCGGDALVRLVFFVALVVSTTGCAKKLDLESIGFGISNVLEAERDGGIRFVKEQRKIGDLQIIHVESLKCRDASSSEGPSPRAIEVSSGVRSHSIICEYTARYGENGVERLTVKMRDKCFSNNNGKWEQFILVAFGPCGVRSRH
jgi:hypothetical protein